MLGEKMKMVGITQNGLKSLIFIVIPKQRKQLKYWVFLMEGICGNKDNDSSDKSKNSDNDKDNISDNDNNSNMKVIQE